MILTTLPTGPLEVNCYIVGCEKTHQAAVIDPGGDVDSIMQLVQKHGLTVEVIINTHGHFDHVGGNRQLQDATGAQLLIHKDDIPLLAQAETHASVYGLQTESSPAPTGELVEGTDVRVGELSLQVFHTPGHSPGGVCLYVDGNLIVGDTLFAGSIGRTDLPGGDYQLLIANIKEKLLPLPEDTKVHPGHGPMSTIGAEKLHNPFLQ
ncbi:MAG: MBL fold metallo-hydrolase [Desulfuromonadales bacterium]|nr:MBL fold metallo-hydrolase [Desulfuromonadales bacterium]